MLSASQLKGLRALVVGDIREMRTRLRDTLAEVQIKNIVLASDARAAVDAIRAAPFNLILSDYDLGTGTDGTDGLQLLEYVRQERLMSPGGLFFVISADSSIDRVASAAEMLPDGYLVKPFATDQLLTRIEEALARHVALRPMYEAVHAERFAEGLEHCERLEKDGPRYRIELLRYASMCQVALARWDAALQTYRRALQLRSSLTWASVGIARCMLAMGDTDAARQRLDTILMERRYHAGAYELLLELFERSGDLRGALKVATTAAEHIPSALRSRRQGEIAYLAGALDTADTALSKVVRQTANAITRDSRNSALLAQVSLERGDPQRAIKLIAKELADQPGNPRTQALAAAIEVQALIALGRAAEAQAAVSQLTRALSVDAEPRTRLLVAKAALTAGMTEQGLEVLDLAVAAADRLSSAENVSMRALASKVLVDAGMPERASWLSVDHSEEAAKQAEAAVRKLRAGSFDEAVVMVNAALPKARNHTGVLISAVEIYLMTMRVKGVRPDLLAQVQAALTRLRERGTANPERLKMMDAYLHKLEAASMPPATEASAVAF